VVLPLPKAKPISANISLSQGWESSSSRSPPLPSPSSFLGSDGLSLSHPPHSSTTLMLAHPPHSKSRFPAVWAEGRAGGQGSIFAFWKTNPRSDWVTLYFTLLATTVGIMVSSALRSSPPPLLLSFQSQQLSPPHLIDPPDPMRFPIRRIYSRLRWLPRLERGLLLLPRCPSPRARHGSVFCLLHPLSFLVQQLKLLLLLFQAYSASFGRLASFPSMADPPLAFPPWLRAGVPPRTLTS
jgi:hypothetical protein